jgi:hypothetical protein
VLPSPHDCSSRSLALARAAFEAAIAEKPAGMFMIRQRIRVVKRYPERDCERVIEGSFIGELEQQIAVAWLRRGPAHQIAAAQLVNVIDQPALNVYSAMSRARPLVAQADRLPARVTYDTLTLIQRRI